MATRRRLAVGVALADLVLLAGGLALLPLTAGGDPLYTDDLGAALAFTVVGGILAARVPANPLGWLFLAGGTGGAVAVAADRYTEAAFVGGLDLPGAELVLRVTLGTWLAPFVVLPFLIVLFPDGRAPSRGWSALLRLAGAALAVMVVALVGAMVQVPVADLLSDQAPQTAWFSLLLAGGSVLLGAALVAVAAPLARWRRARGAEREQLRWFAAGGLLSVSAALGSLLAVDGGTPAANVLGLLATTALPAGMAVAVLRHRLYDLGRLVNRTVVYALLSGVLVVAYLGTVGVVRAALRPLTGESQLAVAASTLAVATLATPLRSRIQVAVDRRFDRHRYDARRIAEQFRAALRDELDLDSLGAELLTTVHHTVSPARASLWLRDPP